jgi:formylmethanofuran dehydrogenase subunit B
MMASKNIICPVCGASCDDIQVEFGADGIVTRNACKMGNAKFQEIVSSHRIRDPFLKDNKNKKDNKENRAIESQT